MKIGVDCDGVLTDLMAYYQKYGKRHFRREPEDPSAGSISDMFGCTDRAEFFFGMRYFIPYCKKWPPRENAADIIQKLADRGHGLYEITARKFATAKGPLGWYSRYLFERWLAAYNFAFNDIYYCSESRAPEHKLAGCRKFSVDIMIDDRPDVAQYLAGHGIRVLLFDTAYNKGVEHNNITRINSWEEIYAVIVEKALF